MADYGYGDAAPDSEKYAYGDGAPDSTSRQANDGEYDKLGYGHTAAETDCNNPYGYGAGSPDPSASPNDAANDDHNNGRYGQAAPESYPSSKYGYEQAAPDDQNNPYSDGSGKNDTTPDDYNKLGYGQGDPDTGTHDKYGYGQTNPDEQGNSHGYGSVATNSSGEDYSKLGYGDANGSNQENPYGYGDSPASGNPYGYGDTAASSNNYGYGDPNPGDSAKYGYYTADYNDESKRSGKDYRRSGRSKSRTHSHDGAMGGWDGLDTGSVHSTHTAESYGEYNSSGTDSEGGGAHHPPQRRQRYRRRGSVTKYSLEATHTVRQQYDAEGNPLPTGTSSTMQPDQQGETANGGGGSVDIVMQTDVDADMNKSHSAMSIQSDEDGGNTTDEDGQLFVDEGDGAIKKKKRSKGRKLGRIVKKGVKAIGRRRASMDY